MRKLHLSVAIVGLVGLVAMGSPPAGAGHSWESFHWSRSSNPANLQLVDSLVGEWDSYFGPVLSDWDRSQVLALTSASGADSLLDRVACLPIQGKVRVCNAKYLDPTWLGLATVWVNGDHIVQATAQVNDTWFDTSLYNDANAKRHVLCQEVGHAFGLDHQYSEPSCMDDIGGLFDPAYVSPASHDYAQLDAIYAHLDGAGGGGNTKGNNGRKDRGGAERPDCHGGSCGSEMRVWREGELTVIQHVLLAPDLY